MSRGSFFGGLLVGVAAANGCEPATPAAGGRAEPYTIERVAGDDFQSVYHIRDRATGRIFVMAWFQNGRASGWVKIGEIGPPSDGRP